jgi:hypothetical protein
MIRHQNRADRPTRVATDPTEIIATRIRDRGVSG